MHRVSRALRYVLGAPALSRAIRSTTRRHGLTPAFAGHRMTGLNGADTAMPALLRLQKLCGNQRVQRLVAAATRRAPPRTVQRFGSKVERRRK